MKSSTYIQKLAYNFRLAFKPTLTISILAFFLGCNNPQAGKINGSSQKELGALANNIVAPTTTSSIVDGLYSPFAISLACDRTAGSDCLATYYTIDGTEPNRASSVYAGPIAIWSKTTLKYFSIDKAGNIEPVKTQSFLVGAIKITDIDKISGGWDQTLGLKKDGTLWGWGGNSSGQLGDGTTENKTTPVQIGTDADWTAIAAGNSFSLALKNDGTLWSWGLNSNGQLGDGTLDNKKSPVKIAAATKWKSVAAGTAHALAITVDGTLWSWGANGFGQLGNGTIDDKNLPVQIDMDTDWTSISAGYSHSAAIKNSGTLWTWGGNASGQLGDGTNEDRNIPTQISGTDWSAISVGGSALPYAYPDSNTRVGGHTVALKNDGTLWAWGENIYGQLGDGTGFNTGWSGAGTYPLKGFSTFDRSLPFKIGVDTDWIKISAGAGHTVALKNSGTLWAWGLNVNGQLANGIAGMNNLLPLPVGPDNNLPLILPKYPWSTISAGGYHTIALRNDGTLWTWGWNNSGQLGDATAISTGGGNTPVTVRLNNNSATLPTWKSPKFAFAVSDKVYSYTVDYTPATGSSKSSGTGKLIPNVSQSIAAGNNPNAAVAHPAGNFLYVTDDTTYTVDNEKISYLHPFSINRDTGKLTEISTGVVKTLYSPKSITIDPLGRFLYVIGTHSKGWEAIAVYTINPVTGELVIKETAVMGAKSMVIEPLGRFAFVLKSTGFTGYSIDQTTGMLSSVLKGDDEYQLEHRWKQEETPRYLSVDISGQFLYASKQDGVLTYNINLPSGRTFDTNTPKAEAAASPIIISPAGINDNGFAVDSHTQYAYMLFNSKLYGLTLNQITGQLNDVGLEQDATTLNGATGAVALPVGQIIYLFGGRDIYAYGIDAASGKTQIEPNSKTTVAAGTLKALVITSY